MACAISASGERDGFLVRGAGSWPTGRARSMHHVPGEEPFTANADVTPALRLAQTMASLLQE